VIDALAVVLCAAGALAGVTGTWSPCGFSMIETLGPVGHTGGRSTTIAACLTFAVGALAGGMATFGGLALAGAALHGASSTVAYAVAAAIALAGALLELRGARIVPQVRRQLPEHWRRLMPMPLAAALYGVLLGLGFTTFVLTFGVFALAGVAFAVGDPAIGLALGAAFGLGRALPVALVAPFADRESGIAITEAMACRPRIYRGIRIGDGLALCATAAALAVAMPAGAAQVESKPAADPGVSGDAIVFQRPDGSAYLRRDGRNVALPGGEPALGGGRVAVVAGGGIAILSANDLTELGTVPARHVDALAISRQWLVWREHHGGRDALRARDLSDPARPGPTKSLGRSGRSAQLGRPSLSGSRVVYARATRGQNRIVSRKLGAKHSRRAKRTLIGSRAVGLSNPALHGGKLLYVRTTRHGDLLKLRALHGRGHGRTLMRSRRTLWSTALTAKRAYVTVISGSAPRQKIVSVAR
jgi:hypothetical protein